MPLDLDALELPRIGYSDWPGTSEGWTRYNNFRNALPELLRLARIGQKVERDAKHPDFLSQSLNEGDGVYRP